ncbi:MAG: serine/threonine protein kinase [Deltaproteobacteria bacterium]|nr:serine/threonine protein kinase [Deltaproteobacteria bacterium]
MTGSGAVIGTRIKNRYHITQLLGEGGMGSVYQAWDPDLNRSVAVKVLHSELARQQSYVRRFQREARLAASITHEHIVDIYDFGELQDGSPFIVQELLEGTAFDREVDEKGPQPLARAVKIIDQACSAVGFAHEKGIVHRDLKPENLFLVSGRDYPDFVKILDFGIAKKRFDESLPNLTVTNSCMGTPPYMAPEQLKNSKDVDHRADIYAIGCTLYYALTSNAPFSYEEGIYSLVLKKSGKPPDILQLRPDLDNRVSGVIRKAMATDPADRFQNIREFRQAILPFEQGYRPSFLPRRKALFRKFERRYALIAIGLAAIVALSALLWRIGKSAVEHKSATAPSPVENIEPFIRKENDEPETIRPVKSGKGPVLLVEPHDRGSSKKTEEPSVAIQPPRKEKRVLSRESSNDSRRKPLGDLAVDPSAVNRPSEKHKESPLGTTESEKELGSQPATIPASKPSFEPIDPLEEFRVPPAKPKKSIINR